MQKIVAIILCLTSFSVSAITPAELLSRHSAQFPHTLSDQKKQKLAKYVAPFITENMNGHDIGLILEAMHALPKGQRKNIATMVISLMTERPSGEDVSTMVWTAVVLSPARGNILTRARHFIKGQKDISKLAPIRRAVAKVAAGEWADVLMKSKPLIADGMDEYSIYYILEAVAGIDAGKRKTAVARTREMINLLIQGKMSGYDISKTIEAVAKVDTADWTDFVGYTQQFITDEMLGMGIRHITESVANVDAANRADVIGHVQRFKADKVEGINIIISAIAKVDAGERADIMDNVQRFKTDRMSGYDIRKIIEAVAKVDPTNRGEVIGHAQSFSTDEVSGLNLNRIIKDVATIPSAYRGLLDSCVQISDVQALCDALGSVGEASYAEFHADLIRRINDDEETALAGGEAMWIEDLIAESRNVITQRMAAAQPREFYAGRAYEIHNAVKVMVTMGGQKIVAPMAIEHVLENLGVERMILRDAVSEMDTLAKTMENPGRIQMALVAAYGSGDGSFSGGNTRLLGMVWPYMKRLPVSTQESWMGLAIDESYTAYGAGGGLSCSMGVQERLTVSGFLSTLADIDPRLVAISTLLQNVATTEVDPMIEGGTSYLSLETQTAILATKDPDAKTIEGWIRASVKAYAENIEAFKDPALLESGMTPAEDLCGHSAIERKLQEYALPLYTNTEEYNTFDKWRDRVKSHHAARTKSRAIPDDDAV